MTILAGRPCIEAGSPRKVGKARGEGPASRVSLKQFHWIGTDSDKGGLAIYRLDRPNPDLPRTGARPIELVKSINRIDRNYCLYSF
jgi:hypothetical protein